MLHKMHNSQFVSGVGNAGSSMKVPGEYLGFLLFLPLPAELYMSPDVCRHDTVWLLTLELFYLPQLVLQPLQDAEGGILKQRNCCGEKHSHC